MLRRIYGRGSFIIGRTLHEEPGGILLAEMSDGKIGLLIDDDRDDQFSVHHHH